MRTLLLGALIVVASSVRADEKDFTAEPGFTLLFNGKNLDGWKAKSTGQALDGKTEAYQGRFKVDNGLLVIDPSVKGDVRILTARSFAGDAQIRFDFRPDAKCNNDLFLRGQKFDLTKGNVKNIEAGEWNHFEITITGDKIEFKNNGAVQRRAKATGAATPLEIRAEFGAAQFRRLRVKTAS